MGVTPQNMPQSLKFRDYQLPKIGIILQNMLKHQIPYYYPLNQWLVEATNGNQG